MSSVSQQPRRHSLIGGLHQQVVAIEGGHHEDAKAALRQRPNDGQHDAGFAKGERPFEFEGDPVAILPDGSRYSLLQTGDRKLVLGSGDADETPPVRPVGNAMSGFQPRDRV